MTSLIDELEARGLLAQVSDRAGLDAHLASGSRSVYCGFDPTAASLHIGNLVPLLVLRRFQLAGHRPIALVGGATGLIGDPSFRADERSLNDYEVVENWVARIRGQVSRFVELEGNNAGTVVDNYGWTRETDVISFLRDVGKHFSVNAMIQRDSVKSRLDREGAGITFTEFSYMLLQSNDFLELARQHDCTVQVGGSDQWGNIVSGIDLIRRVLGSPSFAMTVPLVTKADGSKFGKTAGGAVWLDADMTSPFSFYQYWLNAADADVVPFLGFFSFLPVAEIDAIGREVAEYPERREGQRILAREVTRIVHGEASVASAERISNVLFGGDVAELTSEDLQQLELDGMETTSASGDAGLLDVMTEAGLAKSNGQARQLVSSKAVRLNGEVVEDARLRLSREDALYGRYHVLRRGKKQWHLVLMAS